VEGLSEAFKKPSGRSPQIGDIITEQDFLEKFEIQDRKTAG
jgi:hypothetical protein